MTVVVPTETRAMAERPRGRLISRMTRVWPAAAAALGHVWIAFGLALVLLLGLEVIYRAQGAARRVFARNAPLSAEVARSRALHPYADSAWFPSFMRERNALEARWEPYAYSRLRSFKGTYINIDESGVRVTPQPPVWTGRPLRVFFFGGSTTWGFADRDSSTRPAVVGRALAAAGLNVEVVNFGQFGYVSAQELHALVTELRRGNVPDAVVFWDGVNDVNCARNNKVPALSCRESERAADAEFNTARRRRGGTVEPRLAVRSLVAQSELLSRFLRTVDTPPPIAAAPEPRSFCGALMADWASHARIAIGLGREYGFAPILVWQPQWQTGNRPQGAYEKAVGPRSVLPQDAKLDAHRIECARVADSLAAAMSGVVFNWARMHAKDTGTVYLDAYSHTTERTTAVEADSLAVLLISRLRARAAARQSS